MKHGWLLNLALLCLVILLGWWAWYKPPSGEALRKPLSTVKPSSVSQVVFRRGSQPAVELRRQDGHWLMTGPLQARADEFQVLRLLTILEAQPTAALPAADAKRFDLDPPSAVLAIDGVEYAFGGINAVTREQYVQRGDTVYTVDLRHGAALPLQPAALIRRALLLEQEVPVAIRAPEFEVRKNDGRWTIRPQVEAGADALQAYADRWRQASAATVAPYDGRKPLADIRVEFADGKSAQFGVLQREPQLLLWRRDNGLQYGFLQQGGTALLRSPAE